MPYRNVHPSSVAGCWTCLAVGRSVVSLSADLGVSDQTIYNWRRQDQIDRGLQPGITSAKRGELRAARGRIVELETELAVTKRTMELLGDQVVSQKTLPGDRDHENRRATHPGGVSSARGVRLGVLRLEVPPAVSPFHPPRLANQRHPPHP